MTDLQTKLEEAVAKFEAMLAPPITVLEIFELVIAFGEIVKAAAPAATEDECHQLLLEAWEWADDRFDVVLHTDAALKWPFWLAPAEAFDGPAIRYIATRVLIPAAAARLARWVA